MPTLLPCVFQVLDTVWWHQHRFLLNSKKKTREETPVGAVTSWPCPVRPSGLLQASPGILSLPLPPASLPVLDQLDPGIPGALAARQEQSLHRPSFYSHCFTGGTNKARTGTVLGDAAGSESHGVGKGEGLFGILLC